MRDIAKGAKDFIELLTVGISLPYHIYRPLHVHILLQVDRVLETMT